MQISNDYITNDLKKVSFFKTLRSQTWVKWREKLINDLSRAHTFNKNFDLFFPFSASDLQSKRITHCSVRYNFSLFLSNAFKTWYFFLFFVAFHEWLVQEKFRKGMKLVDNSVACNFREKFIEIKNICYHVMSLHTKF